MKPGNRFLLVVLILVLSGTGFDWYRSWRMAPRFHPSGSAAYIPQAGDDFGFYVQENRSRIRNALAANHYAFETWPFGTAYPLEKVVDMRSPYEIAPDLARCATEVSTPGFLMVHGLSDSPYLLRRVAESLADAFPCSRIRGLLTPGHGTVPGDLVDVHRRQWAQTLAWGLEGLAATSGSVVVVGYSNGSALALDYYDHHRDSKQISALILLSPGLQVRDPRVHLSPYLGFVRPWISQHDDRDAVKYESFPTSASAQFYHLTRTIMAESFGPVTLPVMMVISGSDTTVNAGSAVNFFCSRAAGRRLALWYQSSATESRPPQTCAGLQVVDISGQDTRYVSHSHVAISIPPDDQHYGLNGNYANCLNYGQADGLRGLCQASDAETVYGENDLADATGRYQGKLIRRATFNIGYAEMMEHIICFVGECQ